MKKEIAHFSKKACVQKTFKKSILSQTNIIFMYLRTRQENMYLKVYNSDDNTLHNLPFIVCLVLTWAYVYDKWGCKLFPLLSYKNLPLPLLK